MIDPVHLLNYVIRPVLKDLELWSPQAERLVLGTACQESQCGRWLRQIGTGPALGIYQMEPATHNDIWENFLKYKGGLKGKLLSYTPERRQMDANEMIGNLFYATAMCRVHYLRVPDKIPEELPSQAAYWKIHYNTEQGAGKPSEYILAWYRFVPTGVV